MRKARTFREVWRDEQVILRSRVQSGASRDCRVRAFVQSARLYLLCAYAVFVGRRIHRLLWTVSRIEHRARPLIWSRRARFRMALRSAVGRHRQSDALADAVQAGDVHNCEVLLARGVRVRATAVGDIPLIVHAVTFRQLDVAKLLIAFGEDPNSVSPLTGHPLLRIACENRDVAMMNMLLEFGASPDARRSFDFTCLMYAAANGMIGAATLLLDNHANPNIYLFTSTALQFAIKTGNDEIADILRRHGAKTIWPEASPNITDEET